VVLVVLVELGVHFQDPLYELNFLLMEKEAHKDYKALLELEYQ
jgi:hypothetical protein